MLVSVLSADQAHECCVYERSPAEVPGFREDRRQTIHPLKSRTSEAILPVCTDRALILSLEAAVLRGRGPPTFRCIDLLSTFCATPQAIELAAARLISMPEESLQVIDFNGKSEKICKFSFRNPY